ncbi:Uncharacterised protein [Comamonas aquatica]|nr:Uncharacterised protein [Comamonas aquatica]CAC9212567.1 Uncharacterised protein [Comamonas aquatica]
MKMSILEIFRNFTMAIADIDVYRKSVESAADRTYNYLLQYKDNVSSRSSSRTINVQNMFFKDATSGKPIFYGFRDIDIDQEILNLFRHTNRQHQWFLVEAYELFEEFLKHAYAFMGMNDPKRWELSDFGDILWDEVESKNFQWFLEKSRKKKKAPLSMLRQFRKVLPRMKSVESSNRYNCDLLVAVTLVGGMRHKIVHAKGIISDRKEFAQRLITSLGYSGAGMAHHLDFIEKTLLVNSENGEIHLLNIPAPDSRPPFLFHYDVLDVFIRFLLTYAHQVYLSLGGHELVDYSDLKRTPTQ